MTSNKVLFKPGNIVIRLPGEIFGPNRQETFMFIGNKYKVIKIDENNYDNLYLEGSSFGWCPASFKKIPINLREIINDWSK